MNEKKIRRLYVEQRWTLRQIADLFQTDHHRIKRILAKHSVEVTRENRRRLKVSDETKKRIGAASKGRTPKNKGIPADERLIRKYIKARMRTLIDLDAYPHLGKLRILIYITSRHYKYFGEDEKRKAFLDRFYFDESFNAIYEAWVASGNNKWWYPSLDHKSPRCNGGNFDLDNLQFITWFENRAKWDMPQDEWQAFKQNTNTRSDLFIENILHAYKRKRGATRRGTDKTISG